MGKTKSLRWIIFGIFLALFWMFVPISLAVLIYGEPFPTIITILYCVGMYFAMPHLNSWLIRNTSFRRVWVWARAKE